MNTRILRELVVAAADRAGIAETAVLDAPVSISSMLLPSPRMEITWLPGSISETARIIGKTRDTERLVTTLRRARFRQSLSLRLAVKTSKSLDGPLEGQTVEDLALRILVALPRQAEDENGDNIHITSTKAEFVGRGEKLVEPIKRREVSIYVTATGYLAKDTEIPLISDVKIIPSHTTQGEG